MKIDKEALKKQIEALFPQLVAWRRDFHRYPELGYHEKRTSAKIAEALGDMGMEVQEGIAGMGVVGKIKGRLPGKTIAFRADMDALQLTEDNEISYASCYPGVMHACGHDGHSAILLGVAKILSSYRDILQGEIRFIFQPAEESGPVGGAEAMINEGVLDSVDEILGLHLWPGIPLGKIGIKSGILMASSDPIFVEIRGKSAHASAPQDGIDALAAAAQFINLLQLIVSRDLGPLESAVVTIGKIHSGSAYNVLADTAFLEGTVRTLDPRVQRKMEPLIRRTLEGVCLATGTEGVLQYIRGYPPVMNDEYITAKLHRVIQRYLGQHSIQETVEPSLAGEDFAKFLKRVPGNFCWLGVGEEGSYPIHHPKFNFNEEVMKTGVLLFCAYALSSIEE